MERRRGATEKKKHSGRDLVMEVRIEEGAGPAENGG